MMLQEQYLQAAIIVSGNMIPHSVWRPPSSHTNNKKITAKRENQQLTKKIKDEEKAQGRR